MSGGVEGQPKRDPCIAIEMSEGAALLEERVTTKASRKEERRVQSLHMNRQRKGHEGLARVN